MRIPISKFAFALIPLFFVHHVVADELQDGPIELRPVHELNSINGKWNSIGAGCVDVNRGLLGLYSELVNDKTLNISDSIFTKITFGRGGQNIESTVAGQVLIRKSVPTLTVDFSPAKESSSPKAYAVNAFGVELYRAGKNILATRLTPIPDGICGKTDRSFVVFYKLLEIYAF